MRVGFVGLGEMGLPIAINLVKAGHEVTGWNRTAGRTQALQKAGGHTAASAAQAAAGADLLITMLADDAVLARTVFGDDANPRGILTALPRGSIHACMGTISVSFSRRLTEVHRAAGHGYVAAPVFGRPQAAEAGKLTVLLAGAPDARRRCRPVLEAVGQQLHELGDDPSTANIVKIAGNFLIGAMMEGVAEAFALGRKHGVPAARLLEIVNGGIVRSPLYESYGTLMAEERFEPAGFKLKLGLKDMRLALAAADAAGVPMPLASMVHDHLLSAEARGWSDQDWTVITRVIAEAAGLQAGPKPRPTATREGK